MPSTPTQQIPVGQHIFVDVINYAEDGVTPDTVEVLAVSNSATNICSAIVDPLNNRRIKITGLQAGNAYVSVLAPGVTSSGMLQVPVQITPPPNLSKIVVDQITGPFSP